MTNSMLDDKMQSEENKTDNKPKDANSKAKISAKEWAAMTSTKPNTGRKPNDQDFDSLGSGSDSEGDLKPPKPKPQPTDQFKTRVEKCSYCKSGKFEINQDNSQNKGGKCILCNKNACENCAKAKRVLPMEKQRVSTIPLAALNKNSHEQKILKDYLTSSGIQFTDILIEEIKNMESSGRTFNGKILTGKDTICGDCFDPIWISFIWEFRVNSLAKMPKEIQDRPNCWYGKECTTQGHNPDHAKKYNHICENMKKKGKK